jgi:ribonucleoside-diphosphate reductase alpha chain
MKPRHTAEQSTVKVNKSEDLAAKGAAAPAVAGVASSESAAPAAPARRGFGGLG